MDRTIELGQIWNRVAARRREVASVVLAITLITAVVSYLLPSWYLATASMMPPSEDVSFGIGNLLKGIGVPGVKVPSQATPAEVFLAILSSRRINEEIIQRFDLRRRYRKKYLVDTLKELRKHTRFSVDDVGVIIVSVEDKDPRRSADMANAYCEALDRFNRESRMTRGRRTRIFLGGRLDSTRTELRMAEQRLANYEAKHKAVALSPEASSAMETASRIYASRAALELRLGLIRSYSRETTDEERQLLSQMAQLDRQLARLPQTGIELARLVRDVQVQQQLHIMLTAQYEEARLNEARDVATVERLDVATPPERKSRPRRMTMIAIAFVLSTASALVFAAARSLPSPAPESQGRGSG